MKKISLQARLSALSVGILLVLVVAGGAFQYFALRQYLRSDEANLLKQRYNTTVGSNLQLLRAGARCSSRAAATPSPTPQGATAPSPKPSPSPAPAPAIVDNRVSQSTAQCIVDAVSGPNVTAVLIDADGRVNSFAPQDKDYPTLSLRDYLDAAQGRTRTFYVVGSGSDSNLVVLHPLGSRNGRSLGVVQLSESAQPLQQTQSRLLFLLAVGTGALMLLAIVLTPILVRRALRPLRRVTEASAELAGGNFTRRVDEPSSQDEVGRLARAFNEMAAAVQAAFAVRAESEAGMRHFVGDASHELRTPLTTIQGQLDLLQRGAADHPDLRRDSLEAMQREVRRMSVLVDDLLTLTRLDNPGDLEPVRIPVDLDQLIAETVEEQSVRAPDQQVEVETSSPAAAVVIGDPDQLRRVILNLANNALSHAPGGNHTWRSRLEGGAVEVSLSDQGPGIPAESLDRVFDRFYRGDDERRSNGSGLGLAIVKSIVEAHGGRVEARSSTAGATLIARLPQARPPVAPTSGGGPGAGGSHPPSPAR
jgi:two-component system OmpR family sensor kinase